MILNINVEEVKEAVVEWLVKQGIETTADKLEVVTEYNRISETESFFGLRLNLEKFR